jgi:hypothetical protein
MSERSEQVGPAKAELAETPAEPDLPLSGGRDGGDDPLMWFPAEGERRASRTTAKDRRRDGRRWWWPALAAAGLVAVAGGVAWILWATSAKPPVPTGRFAVESQPVGAEVWVDGQTRGVTPLELTLDAGTHTIEVRAGAARREMKRRIEPGARVYEYVDLPSMPETGGLSVASRPPGARVSVDGQPRGVTPLVIDVLSVGAHKVTVTNGVSTAEESIVVQPGVTASMVVPLGGAGAGGAGWVSVPSAVALQVYENGTLVGTSEAERIMLPAGRHTFEFRNDTLGFRVTQPADVTPGRVTRVEVALPNGTLHVNAIPWAEVMLDGRPVGATPLANLQVPIGSHELVFRNLQFPEQRRTVTVSLIAPARLGIDMRR